MPTISVNRDLLFEKIGQTFSDKEFDELCFEFGIELDDVVTERTAGSTVDSIVYKVEIPANRYDMLCVEGLARALAIFLQKIKLPNFVVKTPSDNQILSLSVTPNTQLIRPFVVAAVLRNVTFTAASYASFIDLQDKLHQNLCRKRTLVAIGTHDLDTIKGPFVYDAKAPVDIQFKPLNQTQEFNGVDLMQHYSVRFLDLNFFQIEFQFNFELL
jgi:phenylalanyl-tRNA synthetase beta chain